MSEGAGAPLWRRLAAAAIDAVLFVVIASLASVALYMATGGVVRAYTFAPATRCEPVASIPAELAAKAQEALPGGAARITGAVGCRRLFLGLESGRFISLSLEVQQGETLMGATVFQPVNRHGAPVQPLSLGWAYPLVFILILALSEALFQGTPGKAGLGLRTVGAAGGRPGLAGALLRNLVAWSWLAAGALLVLASPHLARLVPALVANAETVGWAAQSVVAVFAAVALGMLIGGRPDPAYDRWAGVRVVTA